MNKHDNPDDNKTRSATLVRYGLAILITLFLFREAVYVQTTLYPGWLFLVLFVSVILLLLPYERFWGSLNKR